MENFMDDALLSVPVSPNEDVDVAYKRVVAAHAAAGIKVTELPFDLPSRLFLATCADGDLILSVVATKPWTNDEEECIAIQFASTAFRAKSPKLRFRTYCAFPVAGLASYFLSDAKRAAFVFGTTKLTQQRSVAAENMVALAAATFAIWGMYYPDYALRSENLTENIELFVLDVLRTERNPDAADNNYMPVSTLTALGSFFGESIRSSLGKEQFKTVWSDHDNHPYIQITGEKNGQTHVLLHCNPLHKTQKLFENGREDSLVSLESGAIAMAHQQLTEKLKTHR